MYIQLSRGSRREKDLKTYGKKQNQKALDGHTIFSLLSSTGESGKQWKLSKSTESCKNGTYKEYKYHKAAKGSTSKSIAYFLSEKSTINHKRHIIYPCRIFMYALQKLAFYIYTLEN